jgi:di/tricarboxylate transporter
MARLVMPMGFCTILGGTVTMIGSSPLIMLNDLVDSANRSLPPAETLAHFELFSVTPIGLALVASGVAYFLLFGRRLLPAGRLRARSRRTGTARYMRRLHGIDAALREIEVPADSPLAGRDVQTIQHTYDVKIVAARFAGRSVISPAMESVIAAPATVAVIGQPAELKRFVAEGALVPRSKLKDFRYLLARAVAGVAEIIVPPDSSIIGKTVRELRLRKNYRLGLLSIVRSGKPITSALQTVPFRAGDLLICHTRWENLTRLKNDRNFVILTADYPRVPRSPYKAAVAAGFMALSLLLVMLTPVTLPIALLTGAIGMIVSGVLSMDEAYGAIGWPAVFLFVGLLPLAQAVEASGAANYLALHALAAIGDVPTFVLQILLAVLAAALTLVVSNVGATVLLVPVAIDLAFATGADPAMFALTVAISTSNSFVIPTHQVNALVLGAGDYRVADFLRVGGPMTVLYLVISIAALNVLF